MLTPINRDRSLAGHFKMDGLSHEKLLWCVWTILWKTSNLSFWVSIAGDRMLVTSGDPTTVNTHCTLMQRGLGGHLTDHKAMTYQDSQPEADAMYLVSLVDAIDKLLRWGVPQEPDARGAQGFCSHILWGRGRHCPRRSWKAAKRMAEAQEGKERKKRLSCCSRFTGNYSIENRVGDECLQKLIEALQRKRTGLFLFLLQNSLRHRQKSGLDHLIPRVSLSSELRMESKQNPSLNTFSITQYLR